MVKSLFILLSVAVANSTKSAAPEYRFNVGEELVYELVSTEDLLEKKEKSDRRYETKARWNVYPIRRNADGSWHLVINTWVKLLAWDREKTDDGKLGEWKQEPHVRLENSFLGYCDLNADGTYATNPTLGRSYFFALLPELLFVPLPTADSAPRIAPVSGTTYTLQVQSATDGSTRLTGTLVRPESVNYEARHTLDVEFDAAAGRVKDIAETIKSDWEDHPSHSRTTYRLIEVVRHSPEWTAKFEAPPRRTCNFATRGGNTSCRQVKHEAKMPAGSWSMQHVSESFKAGRTRILPRFARHTTASSLCTIGKSNGTLKRRPIAKKCTRNRLSTGKQPTWQASPDVEPIIKARS
jgi:hypothetical protein